MRIVLLIAYVLFLIGVFFLLVNWSRKKKREYSSFRTQQKLSPLTLFLVKSLKKDWYVSVWFCIGFAVSGYVAVLVFRTIMN